MEEMSRLWRITFPVVQGNRLVLRYSISNIRLLIEVDQVRFDWLSFLCHDPFGDSVQGSTRWESFMILTEIFEKRGYVACQKSSEEGLFYIFISTRQILDVDFLVIRNLTRLCNRGVQDLLFNKHKWDIETKMDKLWKSYPFLDSWFSTCDTQSSLMWFCSWYIAHWAPYFQLWITLVGVTVAAHDRALKCLWSWSNYLCSPRHIYFDFCMNLLRKRDPSSVVISEKKKIHSSVSPHKAQHQLVAIVSNRRI